MFTFTRIRVTYAHVMSLIGLQCMIHHFLKAFVESVTTESCKCGHRASMVWQVCVTEALAMRVL